MRLNSRTLLASLLLALMLHGCSTAPPAPGGQVVVDTVKHQRQLAQLRRWTLEGKLGYQSPEHSGSALLQWQQQRQTFDLRLSGPFGIKATRIFGNDRHAELRQSGLTHYTAASASELTTYIFGWTWPVDELLYWIKGVPAPDTPVATQQFNEQGLLGSLQQSGWDLKFSHYQYAKNLFLPGKISGSSGDLRFTLVIKNWQPGK